MSKPPTSPPHSDMSGVHRDGTRPSKPLPSDDAGEALERAAREDSARPDYQDEESADDRSR